jgi:hypothetical protein
MTAKSVWIGHQIWVSAHGAPRPPLGARKPTCYSYRYLLLPAGSPRGSGLPARRSASLRGGAGCFAWSILRAFFVDSSCASTCTMMHYQGERVLCLPAADDAPATRRQLPWLVEMPSPQLQPHISLNGQCTAVIQDSQIGPDWLP